MRVTPQPGAQKGQVPRSPPLKHTTGTKKCLFSNWVTASSDTPTPELCFLSGLLREHSSQRALR